MPLSLTNIKQQDGRKIPNIKFMKIYPAGAIVFHEDRQTDRQTDRMTD